MGTRCETCQHVGQRGLFDRSKKQFCNAIEAWVPLGDFCCSLWAEKREDQAGVARAAVLKNLEAGGLVEKDSWEDLFEVVQENRCAVQELLRYVDARFEELNR